jgi:hypothetical protein
VILIPLVCKLIFIGWGFPFPIVLVPRYKLSLCHSSQTWFTLFFGNLVSLCVGYMTTWSRGSHHYERGQQWLSFKNIYASGWQGMLIWNYFLLLNSYNVDVDQPRNINKDQFGPMTWSKTKALNALILKVLTKSDLKGPLEYQEEVLVHLIHVQERPNPILFRPWGKDSKGNKRILLRLGNNMGGYLFLLFLGLMSSIEGYK